LKKLLAVFFKGFEIANFPTDRLQTGETWGNLMNKMILAAVLMTASVNVSAQTSSVKLDATQVPVQESVLKVGEVSGNKQFEEDKNITDARIKADAGSLSRYSMKVSLSYFGPPVGDLSNKKQPNPDGAIGPNDTAFQSAVSARYRLSKESAISLGTGIGARTPFHGTEQVDVKNPFIGIDRTGRLGEMQMRNQISLEAATYPEYRDVGQWGTIDYKSSLVYNFGASPFAFGFDTSINYFMYERAYEKNDKSAGRYSLAFYPELKYNFSDKLNFSSSLAVKFTNPRARDNEWDILNRELTQRLGLGYAYSRDIYFAPYLNMYPNNYNMDSTTISFSTIFSVL
jgi:hypothetical protein